MVDLIVDPFDDVRSSAASFLRCFPKQVFTDLWNSTTLRSGNGQSILARVESLMQLTGRADFGDGYGRLSQVYLDRTVHEAPVQQATVLSLLDNLERDVQVATTDLARAVAQAPVHGRLIAFR